MDVRFNAVPVSGSPFRVHVRQGDIKVKDIGSVAYVNEEFSFLGMYP